MALVGKKLWWIAAVLILSGSGVSGQETDEEPGIEDLRLVNGTYGSHMGRVEVLYNGTWGTICNSGWRWPEARAACKSLGYLGAVCVVRDPSFPLPTDPPPVVISDFLCTTRINSLDACEFVGVGDEECPEIGGDVICAERGVVGQTTDVTAMDVGSHSVDLTWKLPPIPEGVVKIRFSVRVIPAPDEEPTNPQTTDVNITSFNYTLEGLTPNTSYTVAIRTDVQYEYCGGFLWGTFSKMTYVTTAVRVSTIPVRLVAPYPDVDFFGRVEVFYNDTWGTVCDDWFGEDEARVICSMLNYEKALCSFRNARYGPGEGPIWLDNVNCSADNYFLEDCDSNDWGDNNCKHSHDVSVICQPPTEYTAGVTGLTVDNTSSNSVDLSWDAFPYPPSTGFNRYLIRYKLPGDTSERAQYVNTGNRFTIRRGLKVNITVNFTVAAQYKITYCNQFILGDRSEVVSATTQETAPSASPTNVHVLVLNSTAVEVQWNLPPFNLRNGLIRGFKVFVRHAASGSERVIDVTNRREDEAIVGDLEPGTAYSFSVLAYTVADGPRSIYLTLSTFSEDYVELIIYFGPGGNGLDRATRNLGQRNLNVHCGSGINGVQISWYYPNGTEISYTNRFLRQGETPSGISQLQIGNRRGISFCDAGVYVCRAVLATNDSEVVQTRNFSLQVESSPPSPGVPFSIEVGSTWITLGWSESSCDGGHVITEFILRYQKEVPDYYVSTYDYIYGISPALRNYTVYNLDPETSYIFSVQALSTEYEPSDFSDERAISTWREAPSAPLDVVVRLVKPPVVEVTWKVPAAPNGIILYYTVYATDLFQSEGGVAISNKVFSEPIIQKVPGHIGAVNMTIPGNHADVQFQVSATVEVDGVENEGELSEITTESIVFVPSAGLPIPENVRVTGFSNTSVTISWDYPATTVAITGFKISYTAAVREVSAGGYLLQFDDSGTLTVTSSTAKMTQLVPETEYRFRVSALTELGQGQEEIVVQSTSPAYGVKFTYFQLRLNFPTMDRCDQMLTKENLIRESILQTLNDRLCSSCGSPSITLHSLIGCVYRARIVGTDNTSAGDFVKLLQDWVSSSSAMLDIDRNFIAVDSSCPTLLDTPAIVECTRADETTVTTATTGSTAEVTYVPTTSPEIVIISAGQQQQNGGSINKAEVGGLVIGVIIIVLLVIFVILLVLLLVRTFYHRDSTPKMKKLNEEVVFTTPKFDQESELSHNNPFFGDSKGDDGEVLVQ